jgi:hypothetical protein
MSSVAYAKLQRGEYITPFYIQMEMEKYVGEKDAILAMLGKLECPECSEELVFVQETDIAKTYFRHKTSGNCAGGEEVLRKVAKALIAKYGGHMDFYFRCHCNRRFSLSFRGTFYRDQGYTLGENSYTYDIGVSSYCAVDQVIEVGHTAPLDSTKVKDMNKYLKKWCEVDALNVIAAMEGTSSPNDSLHVPILVKQCMIQECSTCEYTRTMNTIRASMWTPQEDDSSPFQQLTNEVMRSIKEKATELKINYKDSERYTQYLLAGDLILQAGIYRGMPISFVMEIDHHYISFLAGYRNREGLELFTEEEKRKAAFLLNSKCHQCLSGTGGSWRILCQECFNKT